MASSSMETPRRPPLTIIRDVDDGFISEEDEEWDMSNKRVSTRLSMDGGSDADDEGDGYRVGDCVDEEDEVGSGVNGATYRYRPWPPHEDDVPAVPSSASLPSTPDRGTPCRRRWLPGTTSGNKEYASETEARRPPGTTRRREREVRLDRAWRVRKQQMLGEVPEPVVVLGSSCRSGVAMDVEEVRACMDLGLDLPCCDWTVDIPCCYADTASSGANSPASGSGWRISSPGDDPEDVKARLKMWAQAVALASASRLSASPLHM